MSENKAENTTPESAAATTTSSSSAVAVGYETQQQRWVKYGANVVLVGVIGLRSSRRSQA